MVGESLDAQDETSTPPTDEVVFFLALGAAYIYFLVLSLDFNPDARLFPLSIIPVVLLLIAFRLLELFRGTSHNEEIILESEHFQEANPDEETEQSGARLARMCVWPLAFASVMYVLGIYFAIPILMFAFLFVESDFNLIQKVGVSGFVFVLIYVLFDVILNMYPYGGLLFSL